MHAEQSVLFQIFETPKKLSYFITDKEKRDLELESLEESQESFSLRGELSESVFKILEEDQRFKIADQEVFIQSSLYLDGLVSVAKHKNHHSFFLEFSKIEQPDENFITILIDPGHGGLDRGAANGPLKEKEVTLRVAQLLKKELLHNKICLLLTRDKDMYLSLKERVFLTSNLSADLFLSLHIDSFENSDVYGAAVFSSGEYQQKLLESNLLKIDNRKSFLTRGLDKKQVKLKPVLASVVNNMQSYHEKDLGNKILSKLSEVTPLHNSRIKKAPFYVIKHHLCPSLLIELGFISHDETAQRLASDHKWVKSLAVAIAGGTFNYLYEFYPFLREDDLFYEVQKGDTLSSIALKQGCSVQSLIQYNQLKSDKIYPGQKIYLIALENRHATYS